MVRARSYETERQTDKVEVDATHGTGDVPLLPQNEVKSRVRGPGVRVCVGRVIGGGHPCPARAERRNYCVRVFVKCAGLACMDRYGPCKSL